MDLPFVNRRRQRGLALLIMVMVLILGSAFFLVRQLNSTALRLNSAAATTNVLAQAKEALIGYAAVKSGSPGALLCPDLHAPGDAMEGTPGDVVIGTTCTTANRRIGRLPWKTLGLPDLRDASGERLWYALSNNFRDASNVTVNSDIPGTLNLNGNAPPSSPYTATSLSSSIVAIVFAPGAAFGSQTRSPAVPSTLTTVSNYLEGANSDAGNDDVFAAAPASDTFNDTLLAVTHADLFTVVENNVAKRLETEVKPFIQLYVTQWTPNAYPFAFPSFPPSPLPGSSRNLYRGIPGTTYGLLPVTLDPAFLTWRIPAASEQLVTVVGNNGTANGTLTSNCSSTTVTVFRCTITYTRSGFLGNYQPRITVTPTLQNVGMALVDSSNLKFTSATVSILSATGVTLPAFNSTPNTLRADGGVDMPFTGGILRATGTSGTRTVTLTITRSGTSSDFLYALGQPSEWFFRNEWYRMTYYAISSNYGPAKSFSCVTATCLASVANPLAGDYNRGAILVLAGRASKKADGSDQIRPSSSLDDYFEGENMTPSDRVYESKTRSNTFNDKIVVLAP